MVETAKHTPGPWAVSSRTPFDYPSPGGQRHDHCIVGSGDGTFASPLHYVADCGIASDESVQANARLVAVAPRLLAVCQRIERALKLVPCKDGGKDATDDEVRRGEAMDGGKWRAESSVDGWAHELREAISEAIGS